jgi:hypothetical protein
MWRAYEGVGTYLASTPLHSVPSFIRQTLCSPIFVHCLSFEVHGVPVFVVINDHHIITVKI